MESQQADPEVTLSTQFTDAAKEFSDIRDKYNTMLDQVIQAGTKAAEAMTPAHSCSPGCVPGQIHPK